MPPADSFGPHETAGQPYDRPGAEGIRESNRIAYGLMWCFLESVGKDDEFAWTVGERALIESESILLGETVGFVLVDDLGQCAQPRIEQALALVELAALRQLVGGHDIASDLQRLLKGDAPKRLG